jgi:glycerol kinase
MDKTYLLAIDQGTTSSRSIIFSSEAKIVASSQLEFEQYYPNDAWVEHDSNDIWQTVFSTAKQVIEQAKITPAQVAAIGISVQRETTILWNRKTGKPIYNAIVWQDRRTEALCNKLIADGHAKLIQEKTGLLPDPYFSASKIHWLLENIEGARKLAEQGELAFGTVDSFLIWQLTEGKIHATDASNASRTMLFNIHDNQWDDELLELFAIPKSLLPTVKNSSDNFGFATVFAESILIAGNAGDQQCASFGQACFEPGAIKSTYGTGCFLMLNTGNKPVISKNRLLTTVAYRLNNKTTYALEGSIFIAGAAVQWLRDAAHLISDAKDSETIANSIESTEGVYLVPAFTGLGAPYWDPQARGAILGLTRNSGVAHIVRAALEAVCYQTRDLLMAMQRDSQQAISLIKVDGGMAKNNWLMQFLADILQTQVARPSVVESSALGAAFLAGLHVGIYKNLAQIKTLWQQQQLFTPVLPEQNMLELYAGWQAAVKRVL